MRSFYWITGIVLVALVLIGVMSEPVDSGRANRVGGPSTSVDWTPETGAWGFEEIIFVKRRPWSSDHYYTDIDNGTRPDRFDPMNGIYIYNLRTQVERCVVQTADMPGGKGIIGKISLSFDAQKVVFDFRQDTRSGFRIWEVGIDGDGLRQVSFPPANEAEKVDRWGKPWHTDDIHPAYLQDGKIIFSSTRCEHTILCGGSAALTAPVLHRMDPDGSNIEQLSQSPVSEFCPLVLDDGRVLYHRWEYVDKGARVSKSLWSMNPDGSRPQALYGTNDDTTTVYMYPQPLPGSTDQLVTVGTCHFPQGGCVGPIMLIDLRRGSGVRGPDPDEEGFVQWDTRYAVNNVTPHVFIERRTEPGWFFRKKNGKYVHDKEGTSGHLYTHPYPVSKEAFLVSYKVKASDHYQNVPDAYGLYLLDTTGQHRRVYHDKALSSWHPTPLKAREVPPALAPARDPKLAANNEALCIVTDIYDGMDGVARGSIKWLRINEAVPRYWDTGRRWATSLSSSSWKGALWPRTQWGVVPVEADGSAYFKVPANRNIFFQALDEDFREVQRERTYVNYHPGEIRSCVGCHGKENRSPQSNIVQQPLALQQEPSTPQAQPCDTVAAGGTGHAGQVIHYPTDVQPLLDKHCVECHAGKDAAGDLPLTGEVTLYYNTSYEALAKRELAGPIIPEFTSFGKGDRGNYNGAFLPPKQLGSHASALVQMLTDSDHDKNQEVDHSSMLDEMALQRLYRWVDSNYQFYGSYYGRHHEHWAQAEDPKVPEYTPADFRRKASFEEAISKRAPDWHR